MKPSNSPVTHNPKEDAFYERVDPRGNWPEDFSHENGRYQNRCGICEKTFIGHKRRFCCKLCSQPKEPAP